MSCKSNIETWLKKNNTELSWKATSGDDPNKKGSDSDVLNRSEGYEVRDLIAKFFEDHPINCTDENIETAYNAIEQYNQGKSTKRADYITHLKTLKYHNFRYDTLQ